MPVLKNVQYTKEKIICLVENYIHLSSKTGFGVKTANGDYENPYFEFEKDSELHKLLGRERVFSKHLFDLLLVQKLVN